MLLTFVFFLLFCMMTCFDIYEKWLLDLKKIICLIFYVNYHTINSEKHIHWLHTVDKYQGFSYT